MFHYADLFNLPKCFSVYQINYDQFESSLQPFLQKYYNYIKTFVGDQNIFNKTVKNLMNIYMIESKCYFRKMVKKFLMVANHINSLNRENYPYKMSYYTKTNKSHGG